MHRKNPLRVRVKAPSRGLVTRWPTNTADERNPEDVKRAFVVAENVRFEDGVVSCAPGIERVSVNTSSSLLTSLISHWTFDEAPGVVKRDSHGSNDLTDGDSIFTSRIAGKFSSGLYYTDPDHQQISIPLLPASLDLSGTSITITGWFTHVLGNRASIVDGVNYAIDVLAGQMRFMVINGGNTRTIASSVTMTPGTTYFFSAQFNLGTNTVSIRINSTTNSTSSTGGANISQGGSTFRVGGIGGGDTDAYWMDSISIWSRFLSAGEVDSIYNGGTGLQYPFIVGGWNSVYQANLIATPSDPGFFGSTGKLFLGGRTFQADPRQYLLTLTEIYPGASGSPLANTTPEFRWSFTDFLNKAVAVQKDIVPQYYLTGDTRDIPGLPTGNKYDGCETFFNHLLLWKDQILKSSDLADLTTWIPVASSISNLSLTLSSDITQPAAGALATVSGGSNWLPVTEAPTGLTVGQFVRIDDTQSSLPYYNFFTVDAVSPLAGLSALSVSGTQTVGAGGTARIFIAAQTNWAAGQRVVVAGSSTVLSVDSVSALRSDYSSIDLDVSTGASFDIEINSDNTGWETGDFISLGTSLDPGQDVYQITGVKFSAGKTILTISRQNFGSSAAVTSYQSGTYVVRQPWVKLTNSSGAPVSVPSASAITERYAIKLRLQDLTGRTAAAATILAGKKVVTLLANEAGETPIIGGEDNGPIYKVLKMGEYARIFKNRSISVVQYVGPASGTFFIRSEIVNEGLLAREAIVKMNDSRVVFLGNRELYDFQGGFSLTPVCTQYTRTLFDELDRGRVNEVVLHHREQRNEVWVIYPVLGGGFKVLIWNYAEDTATLDVYDASKLILRGAGQLDWLTDPSWYTLAADLSWDRVDPTTSWNTYVGSGLERVTVLLAGDGSVSIHGNVFNRHGLAYIALAETTDEDFGDESIYKYVDSVQLSLQVKTSDNTPRNLFVQVGYRTDLDALITWTAPVAVSASGSGNVMTKVNPGGAGRYLRLRFFSQDVDVQWRIASWVFCVRPGSSY